MIRLFHVVKQYTQDERALDDVSLKLEKGEFAFLTGHSGAGKTTLMRLLFGQEKATSGQIIVDGRQLNRMSIRERPALRRDIGVVFQDFKLLQRRTVFENVAFAMEVLGRPRRETRERVMSVLKQVGLEHKTKVLPSRLSGGEQQRVAIARALVNEPKVVLADEPTGNLDERLALEIMRLFEACNARGTTVLVSTHDIRLTEVFKRRVLTLAGGRLVGDTQ